MPEYTFTAAQSLPGPGLEWVPLMVDGQAVHKAAGAVEGDDRSNWLRLSGWGFDVPPGQSIASISVRITAYAQNEDGEGVEEDLDWQIRIGGFATELSRIFDQPSTVRVLELSAPLQSLPEPADLLTDTVELLYDSSEDVDVTLYDVTIGVEWS